MNSPKTAEIALLFMSELAKKPSGALVSLTQIAYQHSVSVLYLKKIVRSLKKAGLVNSKEGSGGGYELSRSAENINVWDIMESLNAKKLQSIALSKQYCPLNTSCLPQHIHEKINRSIEQGLRGISIQSLIV